MNRCSRACDITNSHDCPFSKELSQIPWPDNASGLRCDRLSENFGVQFDVGDFQLICRNSIPVRPQPNDQINVT